jgi:hypothetical protein
MTLLGQTTVTFTDILINSMYGMMLYNGMVLVHTYTGAYTYRKFSDSSLPPTTLDATSNYQSFGVARREDAVAFCGTMSCALPPTKPEPHNAGIFHNGYLFIPSGNATKQTFLTYIDPTNPGNEANGTYYQANFTDGTTYTENPFNSNICIDSNNFIFMSDCNNSRIVKLTKNTATNNVVTYSGITFVGSKSGAKGYQDGVGTNTLFNVISGMCMDSNNNIYVLTDKYIRKVTPNGTVTTLFSGGLLDSQIVPAGWGTSGLVIGPNGNLYGGVTSIIEFTMSPPLTPR